MQVSTDTEARTSTTSESSASNTISVEPEPATSTNFPKRKKSSLVWDYFKRSSDKKLAKCYTCGREYKTSGNTSNLFDHLKRFHPTITSSEGEEDPSSSSASGTTNILPHQL